MLDFPRKFRNIYGYNDQMRSSSVDKTIDLMMDDAGVPLRKKGALGPRRLYVDNRSIKKRDDGANWNRLTLTRTHQNFTLRNTIEQINSKGSSVIWCSQGAFGNQTIMTNDPPNGAPLNANFNGMLMSIDVYEYSTETLATPDAVNKIIVNNTVDVSIGEFIRIQTYKRVIANVEENTPSSGLKTITVTEALPALVGPNEKVNYHRNDPYDPDSYHELADAMAMVARIYGYTPVEGGLQPFIDEGLLAANTDQTGGPLNNGTGLGLLTCIEIENEATLPTQFNPTGQPTSSGGEISFDEKSFAACVKKCYDAIRAVDKVVNVMIGGWWGLGNRTFYENFVNGWIEITGEEPPPDLIMSWHGYWRKADETGGITPEVPTEELLYYVPPGWGPRGLFSTIDGWDRKKYLWIQGEYNWNSSSNSNLTAPIMDGLTGTDDEKRQKSQGILSARMTLILLCGRYCKSAINYWLVDDSWSDNGVGQYSNTGLIRNQYNPNSFGVKECMPYHEELMEKMGDCKVPFHLVKGTPGHTIVLGVEEDTNIIRKAEWTANSAVSYSVLSIAYTPSIWKDIFHDLALNGAHASAIATSNQWPAMRGKKVITSGCTYSDGKVVTSTYNSIQLNLSDVENWAEIFIFFESGNNIDILSENVSTQFLSIDNSGNIIGPDGEDTGLNKVSGLNGINLIFRGAESQITLNNGTSVNLDLSEISLSNILYIGGGATISSIFVMGKILYTEDERSKIWEEFEF